MPDPVPIISAALPHVDALYYFDMDGVLCSYNRADYKPGRSGLAPYQTHGAHVFRNIPENPNVMEAFRLLYGLVPKGCCRILTSIPVGVTQAEHTLDKFNWVKSRVRSFREEDFLCVSVPKHNAVSSPLFPMGPNSILIDDWNPNLRSWTANNGTAIKLLNGINSRNQEFINISAGWAAWDIMQCIIHAGQTGAHQAAMQVASAMAGIV